MSQLITNPRAQALADRLDRGAAALAELASGLSYDEWYTRTSSRDARTIGVVVHHVASVYPVEIHLAQVLASGKPVVGVTTADVDKMNAGHAEEHANVTKETALELLRKNSAAASAAIRELTDEQLDLAAPASLYSDAPITCQFMLEDHAVRHSYHHSARISAVLGKVQAVAA
jgi:hypothetical protein